MNKLNNKNQWEKCIQTCLDCYRVCEDTVAHCLSKGEEHAARYHIQLMIDCIELCKLSSDFMIRNSPFSVRLCKICADVCRQCADNCAEFSDDDQMLTCADVCRQCAIVCEEMV